MSVLISLRLPENIISQLEAVASITDRSKSYLIKKAIEQYLEEYADYQIALDRLHDKGDKIVTSKDMRKLLDDKN